MESQTTPAPAGAADSSLSPFAHEWLAFLERLGVRAVVHERHPDGAVEIRFHLESLPCRLLVVPSTVPYTALRVDFSLPETYVGQELVRRVANELTRSLKGVKVTLGASGTWGSYHVEHFGPRPSPEVFGCWMAQICAAASDLRWALSSASSATVARA